MRYTMVSVVAAAAFCAACSSSEVVRFQPKPDQQAIVRDGQSAIVSRKAASIVIARPATRKFSSRQRPVFALGIYNLSRAPIDFRVANVEAIQLLNGAPARLQVIPYEQLVSEEETRQTLRSIGTGLSVAGNALSTANAGRGTYEATTYTPSGRSYTTTGTYYDASAASAAQARASAENAALVADTIATGQRNLAFLERSAIKDNTLFPGEWYGGQLHIQPPVSDTSSGPKRYSLVALVGDDRHEIDIVQSPTR
jgi:hypothetical protein